MSARVEEAQAAIAAGGMVVVVDDHDRENEGDLICAADRATPETLAFMVRHGSGIVCVALQPDRLEALDLPLMREHGSEAMGTAFTVTVDARDGTTTGVSASDRARTIEVLLDPRTVPHDLRRPGHVFPLRARRGGVLERAGHTEAAVDLARLAGLRPAGVLCEVVNDDGTMARLPELRRFAADHGLPLLSIADLIAHRAARETLVRRASSARIPTAHGTFSAVAYEDHVGGHHVALVHGDPGSRPEAVVRVHTECFTGDVLASRRCDCGAQLHQALEAIVAEGAGVLVYVRARDGRRWGSCRGSDAHDELIGAQILADLGVAPHALRSGADPEVIPWDTSTTTTPAPRPGTSACTTPAATS